MVVRPNNLLIIQLETAHESKYVVLEPEKKVVYVTPKYSHVMLEPGDEVEVEEFWECQGGGSLKIFLIKNIDGKLVKEEIGGDALMF